MTPTSQQINHVLTLHRIHKARHKRYRESPLCAAVEDLATLDRHTPLDEPPLLILGPEGREYHHLGITGYCWSLLIGSAVCALIAIVVALSTPGTPQQLTDSDTDRPAPVMID